MSEQEKKISEQEKKMLSVIENSKKESSELHLKISNMNKSHTDKILELIKEIEAIKITNNALNMKITSIEKRNDKLTHELISSKMESKNTIESLEKELNGNRREKEKKIKELDLVTIRDTTKVIIDFIYCILFKNVNLSINYEEKVKQISNMIKDIKSDKTEFLNLLIRFLYDIKTKKNEGDRLAHNGYRSDFLKEYKSVWKFLENDLEVQRYFTLFSSLYIAKNKNEETSQKINYINNYVGIINFNEQLKNLKI